MPDSETSDFTIPIRPSDTGGHADAFDGTQTQLGQVHRSFRGLLMALAWCQGA